MDIIFINEYRLTMLIGVYEWEKRVPQTVQIDLEIAIPDNRAGQSDHIRDTINYGTVIEHIERSVAGRHFGLIERFAEHLAELVMQDFGAPWIKVAVAKLNLMRNVKRIGVMIERGNRD